MLLVEEVVEDVEDVEDVIIDVVVGVELELVVSVSVSST